MLDDRTLRLGLVRTYLSARKSLWLLATVIVLAVVAAVWGSFEASTPAASDSRGSTVPLWRLLAVGAALVPALTLASPMEALEAAAGRSYHRLRNAVLAGATVTSSVCFLTGAALGANLEAIPLIARALPAWLGLALISGRILGWNYTWVAPCGVVCVLLYWGPSSGEGFRWWEFTAQEAGDLPSLLLSVGLFASGLAAYSLTPWRVRNILRPRPEHVNRSDPGPFGVPGERDIRPSSKTRPR
ncbi:hypothetical protein ACGF5C_31075 [Micromonospora sp. NPDC047620]|uniref:hypothetical protein n=1 Tax=Micromonospora sp. NPDC047620 TaxID=3364251 RepID=UPI003712F89A